MPTSLFHQLLETNARLVGALDVPPGETPDVEALTALFGVRAALLTALQEAAHPAPAELKTALLAQHHRLDHLLQNRTREVNERMEQLDRFEHAQARYAPATPRQVLRSGLNI